MRQFRRGPAAVALAVSAALAGCNSVEGLGPYWPEERSVRLRDPAQLPQVPAPNVPAPETVTRPEPDATPLRLSLDEAIRIALGNADVVRVLAGVSASSSGRTVYDAAIAQTQVEAQKGPFDPRLNINNTVNQTDRAAGVFDPLDPAGARVDRTRRDGYDLNASVSKRNLAGGTFDVGYDLNVTSDVTPGPVPLDPQVPSDVEVGYTQPLLQGAGVAANRAPIVIARIETEQSYFRQKDAVQELVRGVVQAYWNVVFARTTVWARRQQVEQGDFAVRRAEALVRNGLGDVGDLSQARVALANFRANLVTAEADLLQREAALRNVLGLPPEGGRVVPTTPPTTFRLGFDWKHLLDLAQERRPDVVELKLILEADQQQLTLADNQAKPRVDAVTLYRWNGLSGTTPSGDRISSDLGESADWSVGVNFSVPLGLRAERAELRRRELLIARDRANLRQGLHNSAHQLALTVRSLDQFYAQYEAFRQTRQAAEANLRVQIAEYRSGRTIFLNVLQAVTDWGNAVSSEAQALTQYNAALADLERQTGTILETHGVRFYEERYESIGPLGRCCDEECYPYRLEPGPNANCYPAGETPSEEFFDLRDPLTRPDDPLPGRPPIDEVQPPLPLPPLPDMSEELPDATPVVPSTPQSR